MKTLGLKSFVSTLDALNTVSGGLSEPFLSLSENGTGREIRVRVPGVSKETLQIEINNNDLMVYYFLPARSADKTLRLPRVVYNQTIPYFVEVKAIRATFEGNDLVVKLPFNELLDGYHQKIKVG